MKCVLWFILFYCGECDALLRTLSVNHSDKINLHYKCIFLNANHPYGEPIQPRLKTSIRDDRGWSSLRFFANSTPTS